MVAAGGRDLCIASSGWGPRCSPEGRAGRAGAPFKVKIAVSSSVFAGLLQRGAFTHLEWLEACASRLDADGVVFLLADFPRTDDEYVAQVKKVATDLGLVPLALDLPGLLDPELPEAARFDALGIAAALGVALVGVTAGPPGDLPPRDVRAHGRSDQRAWLPAAKAANITLVVAPDTETLLADAAAAQNFCKYVDSAWLRYDRPPVQRVRLDGKAADLALPRRGWLVLEGDGGADRVRAPWGRDGGVSLGGAFRRTTTTYAVCRTRLRPAFSRWVRPWLLGSVTKRKPTPIVSGADAPLSINVGPTPEYLRGHPQSLSPTHCLTGVKALTKALQRER